MRNWNSQLDDPPLKLLVIIPVYNEIATLPSLMEQIRSRLPQAHILVVDDSSPDGTGQWVARRGRDDARIELLTRAGRDGLGSATADGIRHGLTLGPQWIATIDGDLSHNVTDLAAMIDRVNASEDVDILIGSRYAPGARIESWSRRRRIASRLVNIAARRALGLSAIRDVSSALRVYRAALLEKIEFERLESRGHPWLEEILLHALRYDARIREHPITFRDRAAGTSKLDARGLAASGRELARLIRRRLKGIS